MFINLFILTLTGTTWLQAVLYLLTCADDLKEGHISQYIDTVIRFLEISRPGDTPEIDKIDQMPPPRILKTHLQYRFLKDQLEKCPMRVIVMIRNPKDVLVSLFHFYKMNKTHGPYTGTWEQFFDMFKQGQLVYGDWFEHTLDWWKNREKDHIMILKYEDMQRCPQDVIHKVAQFCGKELSTEEIAKIAELTSFGKMQKTSTANMSHVAAYDHNISPFLRKGQVGDWKNHFTVAQNEWFDKLYNLKMADTGLHMEFH